MSELAIFSIDKSNNKFTLQAADIPSEVQSYPVRVTATLENGTKVTATKNITIKVTPTISISGADTFVAKNGVGTSHYTFVYTPEKYNVATSIVSVTSNNSKVVVSNVTSTGFDVSTTDITEDASATITATVSIDGIAKKISKIVEISYAEELFPFIMYNDSSTDMSLGLLKDITFNMARANDYNVGDYETYDFESCNFSEVTFDSYSFITIPAKSAIFIKNSNRSYFGQYTTSNTYRYGFYQNTRDNTHNLYLEGHLRSILADPQHVEGQYFNYTSYYGAFMYLFNTPNPAGSSYGSVSCNIFASNLIIDKVAPCSCLSMFSGCTGLTQAPELPATTLASNCYSGMFKNCTSLTEVPENMLPATTLAVGCYGHENLLEQGMFYGCISLVKAPNLPATTLAVGCYNSMFMGCTGLTQAPELPATTLANYCYTAMFNGCSKLNYVKALFTTTPGNSYTANWLYDVASSGTFVKNPDATWSVTGTSGVPSGWTIVDAV